ncbi:DinB family protein [uncultured Flavobacterium sp.]|uniref:DinB family protein n=1 Tax=uncultured Flavobacterium sp. TaxID=165435 RepID=UPI0030CA3DA2
MQTTFNVNTNVRTQFLKYFENYTLEQLNKIPSGFSNNIIWNIAHCLVIQQMLLNKLSGMALEISDEFSETYKNGSTPSGKTTQNEVNYIKSILFSTTEKIKKNFEMGFYVNYNEFTTKSTGFNIKNAKQALEFNNFHEGIHLGVMLQIKKFI